MEVNLVNLTPHEISIANEAGEIIATIPPSGQVARITTCQAVAEKINLPHGEVEVVATVFGQPEGIPQAEIGTRYVVSSLVAQASNRQDLIAPDTGPTAVRDGNGRIIAVRRFQKF